MSKKPKKEEYQASEAEKIEASVAKANYERNKAVYDPLRKESRDAAKTDFKEWARGRNNADVAQATGGLSLGAVENSYLGADKANLAISSLLEGSVMGRNIKNTNMANALASGQKQSTITNQALSYASRIGASDVIANAANKQLVRGAVGGAIGQIGGSMMKAGWSNKLSGTTDFFGNPIQKASPGP